jgi:hypothetical protein
MSKKLLIVAIIILAVVVAVIGLRLLIGEDSWICVDGKWIKHGNPGSPMPESGCGQNNNQSDKQEDIIINSPQTGEIIKSPIKIEGKAKGFWFFEAVFPVKLIDSNNKEISSGQARAQGDWMTSDFVPFIAELDFKKAESNEGFLIFQNDNPSRLLENSKEFRLPVRFE